MGGAEVMAKERLFCLLRDPTKTSLSLCVLGQCREHTGSLCGRDTEISHCSL